MGINERVEMMAKAYGDEAFQNHKKEVYAAVKAMCCCLEFLQDQEEWNYRRAVPLRKAGEDQGDWEEFFRESYSPTLRGEELWRLKETLGQWAGEEIPLGNFLDQGFTLMAEETKTEMEPKEWAKLMETQMIVDQYTDYRAYLEAVYMLGFFELLQLWEGTCCHYFAGDYRDAGHYLQALRERIPQERQKGFDDYCARLLKELKGKRAEAIRQILRERNRGLEKAGEWIPTFASFNNEMLWVISEDEFAMFVEGMLSEADEEAWEDVPEWTQEINLHAKEIGRVRKLARIFIYSTGKVKQKLFQYLPEEERLLIAEQWMYHYYPGSVSELISRLNEISCAADEDMRREGPAPWCCRQDENLMEKDGSFEDIVGRAVTEGEGSLFW